MPSNSTADETLERYIGKLGSEIGQLLYYTHNEWCNARLTWKQYESLFGSGRERVDLLNSAGALFFFKVQKHFFEAVLLAVCRLSDPPSTGKKSNLTVRRFEKFMDNDARRTEMEARLAEVAKATEFARDWRNRMISHTDLDLRIGTAQPLKNATRASVTNALATLHNAIAYVAAEFLPESFADELIDHLNNEMVLLNRLFRGAVAFEKEMVDLKEKRILPPHLPEWLTVNKGQ